jgi:hypothetical protein
MLHVAVIHVEDGGQLHQAAKSKLFYPGSASNSNVKF